MSIILKNGTTEKAFDHMEDALKYSRTHGGGQIFKDGVLLATTKPMYEAKLAQQPLALIDDEPDQLLLDLEVE